MSFKQETIKPLKLLDQITYLSSNMSFTESDIIILREKARITIDRLSIIWKFDLSDKIKWNFFQAAAVSVLLYDCTIWTLYKHLDKKLDGNYTRISHLVLNKSYQYYASKQ